MISKIGSFLLEHACYPFLCFQAFLFSGWHHALLSGFLSPTLDLPPNGLFVCFAGWNWASSLGNGFCATLSSAKLADGKMVGVKHVTSSCHRRIYRDFHISPRNEHSTSEMVLGRKTIFMVSPFELVLKLFTSTLIYTVSLIAMWMFLQMLE